MNQWRLLIVHRQSFFVPSAVMLAFFMQARFDINFVFQSAVVLFVLSFLICIHACALSHVSGVVRHDKTYKYMP